jgi:hypothetical protein
MIERVLRGWMERYPCRERVIRDGMDRYPCRERGVSEVGWTYILARREGSPSDLEA